MELAGVSKKHNRSRGRDKKAEDPYASAYGVVPFSKFRGRPWTNAYSLDESAAGKHVLLFGTVHSICPLDKTRAGIVLLNSSTTVRCVIDASADEGVTTRMVRFAVTRPLGTPIDVEGVVNLPYSPKSGVATTQKVEIQVTKFHSIGLMAFQDRRSSTSITPSLAKAVGRKSERAGQVGPSFCAL